MITNKRRAVLLTCALAVFAPACGPSASSGRGAAVGSSAATGELVRWLERTPPSSDASVTLRRSPVLRATGQHERALGELERAIAAARERVQFDVMARLWRERGVVHLERAEPEQALAAFGKRLEIGTSLKQKQVRASALADTAYSFVLLGRIGQADDAVATAKLIGGADLERDALAQEHFGLIAVALGDEAGARRHFASARAAYRGSADAAAVARIEIFAARSTPSSDLRARLAAIEPTLERIADSAPRAHLALAVSTAALADDDAAGCLEAALRARSLAEVRGLQRVLKHAHIIAARCAEATGDLTVAIESAHAAAALIEDQLGSVRAALARQELGFEAFLTYRLLVELELRTRKKGAARRAFRLSEQARGRAHLDAVVRSKVAPFSATLPPPPGLERDREIAKERVRRLTAALRFKNEAGTAARHRDALWALEEINETIAGQNPLLSRVATPRPATVSRVRRTLLDDDAVMLSYFATAEQMLVFAIDGKREKLAVIDGSLAEIDAAVRSYRNNYLLDRSAGLEDVRDAGEDLYKRLVGPVAGLVRGKKRILVVPHGTLSTLPFEALVTPRRRFVVQDQHVHYTVSASLAVAIAKKKWAPAKAGATFVGLGDPIYTWPSGSKGISLHRRRMASWRSAEGDSRSSSLDLKRIPGTARELREIAKLFGSRAQIHLRADASEELVKSGKLNDHTIVHIASHGLMAPHYQALALTLNPYSSEDGFLMSSEIAQLELKADLVVLSACGTGKAASRSSEPVAGMALSLRSAGARSVLLSLWSVSDQATADLMVAFYRAVLEKKSSYIESLTLAKRELLASEKYGHPFYWAAFALHGR